MKKILFILLFIPSVLFGQTNYYVSNTGGGDTLATIAEVNALALVAGDSVFFKRGDTWVMSTTLFIDRIGESGTHIYFGAYGTGQKPIFNGRVAVDGWEGEWTNTSGNIWRITVSSGVFDRLWIDGAEKKRNANATVTETLPWYWASNLLYVYSTESPTTAFTSMEWIGYDYGIRTETTGADYITLQNLDIRGCYYSIYLRGVKGWLIDSCYIGRDGNSGVVTNSSASTRHSVDSLVISNCVFDSYDRNVDAYSFNNTYEAISQRDGADVWDIYNNVFIDWTHGAIGLLEYTEGYAHKNVKFHDNIVTAKDIDYGYALVYNAKPNLGACSGNEFYNNYCYLLGTAAIQINGDGVKIYNNIIDGVRKAAYEVANSASGVVMQSYSSNIINTEIYNNVFANCEGNGIYIKYAARTTSDNLIKNNIFYNNALYGIRYENSPGYILDQTFSNNLFYKSATTDLIYYEKMASSASRPMTITEFNAMNGITTGMTAGEVADVISDNIAGDPLFVDPDNANYLLRDYNLSVGSPAIAAGIGVGLTTDYAGNAWGTTPSIGALEYDSDPPDPPGLPEVTTTEITSYTVRYATGAGNVTSDGGGTITSRGVCWSTSANPTTADSKFTSGGTTGAFSGRLYPLKANTTYHYRSFAVNESGTSYGADQTFTTPMQSVNTTGGKYLYHNGKLIISR